MLSEGADKKMCLKGNDKGDEQDMRVVEDGMTETRDGMMTSEEDGKTNKDFSSRLLQPGTKGYDDHRQTIINDLKSNGNEAMKKLIAMENYKKACKHDDRQEEDFVNPI